MTGPRRRDCARCGRHGYPAAHFPDGYLCRICLRAGLDIRGTCPGCGTGRALPGLRDRTPVCTGCAGISRHFTCLHCGYEGNLLFPVTHDEDVGVIAGEDGVRR